MGILLFALVLISPNQEGDLEATLRALMEPLMRRGVREWWTIGGRYDGVVQGQLRSPHSLAERTLLATNRCVVRRLPTDLSCHAVVTPDGVWHEGPTGDEEREVSGLTPEERAAYRQETDAWARERTALLRTYQEHIAIGIDYGVWL